MGDAFAVPGDTGKDERVFTRDCCLGLERENPLRTAGKDEQASAVPTFRATRPEKPAPSLL